MKAKSKIFYWYAALVAAYLALALIPAPDHVTLVKYHLTNVSIRLLYVTLFIPLFLIWFAAFYGYRKLYKYKQLIQNNRDGKQVALLTRGLLVLALGLPLSSILSNILNLIARHNVSFTAATVVISNFASALYILVAFIFLGMGARGLNVLAKTRAGFWSRNVVVLAAIVLGVVFCCLIVLDHDELRKTYHMSPQLVMLTLGIPYIYSWFLGLSAMLELFLYSKRVPGVVYRKAWQWLAVGLGAVIIVDILIQYLSTLSTWLNGLSLSGVLLLLYVLLFLWAGAFIVVALGTKRLIKIEEV